MFQHTLILGLNYRHSLLMKKSNHFLNSLKQKLLTMHLLQLKKKVKIHEGRNKPTKEEIRGERRLLRLISDVCNKPSTTATDTALRARTEMRRYMDEDPCEINPLIW